MKESIVQIVNRYLSLFPEEKDRLEDFLYFLETSPSNKLTDWNNFDGHIVTTGFIYSRKENKFLVLHHNDLDMFLSPGGHIDSSDNSILEACKREIKEETSLINIKQIIIDNNKDIPIDIDSHLIKYNDRLDLPSHHHFDFRYLFEVNNQEPIKIDLNEHSEYKWIDLDSLNNNIHYRIIISKIKNYIND